jgi:hypothetical protein
MLNELTSYKWLVFPLFQLVFSSSLCTSQYSALVDHVFPRNMLGTYENIKKNDPRAIEVLGRDNDIRPNVPSSH